MFKYSFLQEIINNAIIMKERSKESVGFYMSEQPRTWQWLGFLLTMVRAGWFFILVIVTGYFIHKKNLWLILTFFVLLIPMANLAFPGSPRTDILLAVLQNLLMLALGYIFRRMLNAHIKMKQLLRENKRQYPNPIFSTLW